MALKGCPEHGGDENQHKRDRLRSVMEALNESQAAEARHKCSYCAYEEGYRQAVLDVLGRDVTNRLGWFLRF